MAGSAKPWFAGSNPARASKIDMLLENVNKIGYYVDINMTNVNKLQIGR
jgi:hypothetical protein